MQGIGTSGFFKVDHIQNKKRASDCHKQEAETLSAMRLNRKVSMECVFVLQNQINKSAEMERRPLLEWQGDTMSGGQKSPARWRSTAEELAVRRDGQTEIKCTRNHL